MLIFVLEASYKGRGSWKGAERYKVYKIWEGRMSCGKEFVNWAKVSGIAYVSQRTWNPIFDLLSAMSAVKSIKN